MGFNALPSAAFTGQNGAQFAAPQVVTLTFGVAYVIPAGDYYLYLTGADMDLEVVTDATTPTWTKFRDGDAAVLGTLVHSDGTNVRLRNTHASATETASLIKIG